MKRKHLDFYTKASKLFEAGYSKVLWRFNSVFQVLLIFSTFLIVQGYEVNLMHYGLMAVSVLIMIFGLGHVYLKFGFFRADQEAIFSENERICAIQKDVKEIKEMLEDLK